MINKLRSLPPGLRTFTIVWVGQLLSMVGSAMTDFAVAVWVFRETGSAAAFGLILLMGILPGILISLVSGVVVDRWDRRLTMIVADSGAAVATLSMALLYWTGRLEVWHVCVAVAIGATMRAFQMPAWAATTSLLVPTEHLGRASGMMNFARSAGQIAGPLLGGVLVITIGLSGVMLIDFATFLAAMVALSIVRFPVVPKSAEAQAKRGSILREAGYGWTYILERPSLRTHLFYFALLNLGLSYVWVLFPPLVLSFANAAVLGSVAAFVGFGFLAGSMLMTAWGGPKNRVAAMLGVGVLGGVCMLGMGLRPWAPVVAAGVFGVCFGLPFLNGAFMRIWQPRIAADVQGRAFAAMQVMVWSTQPIAYLSGGVIADRVFGPMLMPGGALENSVGAVIGVGPGRGIAMMLGVAGLFVLAVTAFVSLLPHFRTAESMIPITVVPTAPAPEAAPEAAEEEAAPVPA